MQQRAVVMTAAWLEIVVGAIILAAPGLPSRLLFGAEPVGAGMPLARFAGVALIGLGIACQPSERESAQSSVLGLFVFNLGVAILFTWVALGTAFRGVLLWPAILLHAVIAAFIVSVGRSRDATY
jgi:hypothetical protein